jgi:hypothetical protein
LVDVIIPKLWTFLGQFIAARPRTQVFCEINLMWINVGWQGVEHRRNTCFVWVEKNCGVAAGWVCCGPLKGVTSAAVITDLLNNT